MRRLLQHIAFLFLLLLVFAPLDVSAQEPEAVLVRDPWDVRLIRWVSDVAQEGEIPLGPVSLDPGKMVSISLSRGLYFGVGMKTNDRFSEWVSLHGFFGYWTRLKDFDYGVGASLPLSPRNQIVLDIDYQKVSGTLGEFGGMMEEGDNLLTRRNFKYTFFENVYVRQRDFRVGLSGRFIPHFKVFLTYDYLHKYYLEPFYLDPALPTVTDLRFSQVEVKLRYAWNEQFIAWLSYMHNMPSAKHGMYEFDRVKFQLSQNFPTRRFGVSNVLLQSGFAFGECPLTETFDILSCYMPVGLYSPGCFNTMRFDEFFCDRFVAVFLSHNFRGMLWPTHSSWFRPVLTLATHIGWGDFPRAKDFPDKNFRTMEQGYFESGVVVDGLLCLPLVKMGVGAFYRYGPYAFGNFKEDIAFKYSLEFEL